ncbi:DUF4278 domain-containing protein [Thermoleptolyngbya oregonensis NK1-22]|uniref:DUF4278 domain-containing protein n=1 Tax=Thermoleptolyngbya oregonensis NK1-22 TaxID=2547457 RepID=A0AA96Y519_9CYAN|nr:DUF4278 domain-containing protein [Thermoleptolyngbya oregonensis]WOB43604.1 DUF4278 domain-containing protein [Thermoleptolyngbya oregonensis NK1-22]
MQLTYRSVNYAYTAAQLEASRQANLESMDLTYRGAKINPETPSATRSPGFPLKYRGVAYGS